MSARFAKLMMMAVLLVGLAPAASAGGYGYAFGYHGYSHHGGHRFHRGGHHRGHYGGRIHGSGDVAIGLFAGAVLGYAIASSYEPYYYRRPYREYRYYEPRYRYYQPRYRYYERAPRVVYAQPRPSPGRASECVQEREYQTTITIDGQQVPAWGVACLQPDGSWKRPGLSIVPRG